MSADIAEKADKADIAEKADKADIAEKADIVLQGKQAEEIEKASRYHPIVFELSEREKGIVRNLG